MIDKNDLEGERECKTQFYSCGIADEQQYWLNEEAGHVISAPAGRG